MRVLDRIICPRCTGLPCRIALGILTLFYATLFIWAGGYHIYLGTLGVKGISKPILVNAVQEALKESLLYMDPIYFLYALGALETLVGLAILLAVRRKPPALFLAAGFILLASIMAVLANPSLVGVECGCWGVNFLSFDHLWQVLIRNAALVALGVLLARAWRQQASPDNS